MMSGRSDMESLTVMVRNGAPDNRVMFDANYKKTNKRYKVTCNRSNLWIDTRFDVLYIGSHY